MQPTIPVALGTTLAALAVCAAAHPASAAPAPPPVTQQRQGQAPGCLGGSHVVAPGTPWPVRALGLDRVRQISTGASVTVAVLGSGVQTGAASQLAGQVTDGPRISGPAGQDCVGHGTVIAGLIAATPSAGSGFVGIAPGAHLYALAVADGTGATTPTAIAAGIRAAVAAHARVIDVAVATTTANAGLAAAVRDATAAGALVVAPATLDGQTRAATVYPAAYPGVLSVAATGADGVQPTGQPVGAPVDLLAPGDAVVGVGPGGGEFAGSGASFATAYAAGAAALVDAYRGPLAPAALVHRLEATAVHPGTTLPDPGAGYGSLDPFAALTVILPEESAASLTVTGPRPTRLTVPRPPGRRTRNTAFAVAAGGLALTVGVALAAAALPRGRRRGWRPGTRRA